MLRFSHVCAVGACLLAGGIARAGSVLIDFENDSIGQHSTLSETDPSLPGPVTVSTPDGSAINVEDISATPGTISFGDRSLSTTFPLLINFPIAMSSVSILTGHSDGVSYNVTLTAFSQAGGMGTVLGTDTESLIAVGSNFNFANLEVDSDGILSAEVSMDTPGGNGIALDNLGITTGNAGGGGTAAVPLPKAASSFVGGAIVAVFAGLRMRKSALRNA